MLERPPAGDQVRAGRNRVNQLLERGGDQAGRVGEGEEIPARANRAAILREAFDRLQRLLARPRNAIGTRGVLRNDRDARSLGQYRRAVELTKDRIIDAGHVRKLPR
jgi:hypothetical protein